MFFIQPNQDSVLLKRRFIVYLVAGLWPLVSSDRPIGDVPAMPSWPQACMVGR
jgi:hypothetical protein